MSVRNVDHEDFFSDDQQDIERWTRLAEEYAAKAAKAAEQLKKKQERMRTHRLCVVGGKVDALVRPLPDAFERGRKLNVNAAEEKKRAQEGLTARAESNERALDRALAAPVDSPDLGVTLPLGEMLRALFAAFGGEVEEPAGGVLAPDESGMAEPETVVLEEAGGVLAPDESELAGPRDLFGAAAGAR